MQTTMLAPLIPLISFALYTLIFLVALDLPQAHRIYAAPVLLYALACSFLTASYLEALIPALSQLWVIMLCVSITHNLSVLYIERTTVEETLLQGERISRIHAKLRIWSDPQRLFRRRTKVPERAAWPAVVKFLLVRVAYLVVLWAIHTYIATKIFPAMFVPLSIQDFSPSRQTFLRRALQGFLGQTKDPITLHQILLRAGMTCFWFWTSYATLKGADIALSIFFVGVRLDDPVDWPHIFGRLSEAYTVRRLWSKFWHQIPVPVYTIYCKLAVKSMGFRTNSPVGRILLALGVFAFSGMIHTFCSLVTGDRCGYMDDTYFFLANFAAGAIETLWIKQMLPLLPNVWWLQHPAVRKGVGYAWVGMFLFWSVPKWQYRKLQCGIENALR